MTVIETLESATPAETTALVTWIFKCIGDVVYVPHKAMDASTALCSSSPAFYALTMEAAIDGAVVIGIPRLEAQRMAAQMMKVTADMVLLAGEHPATLRPRLATPAGCTIAGLMALERRCLRGTIGRAVKEATVVTRQLREEV